MSRLPMSLGCLLAMSLIAACQAPNSGTQPVGRSPRPISPATVASKAPTSPDGEPRVVTAASPPVLSPAPLVVPTVVPSGIGSSLPGLRATLAGKVTAPPSLISDNGLGVVSNNGGGVVSNNGGGLISDNGLGIVSNNGGAYRLAAVAAQVPVSNATVRLLDAAGRPVRDAAGQAITATTGADGAYAFTVDLPTRNLLVAVAIKGGELAGFVPKPPAAGAGPVTVDVDLVSTLATGYVVRQYVQSQLDPLDVLDRLPAAVEAETRALTGGAFAAGSVPLPVALTSERVLDVVRSLRRETPALDGKLEDVRCLLVAAGQCGRGEGQLATDIPLIMPLGLHFSPDGDLLISDSLGSDRVWRVDDGGRARALIAGASNDLGGLGAGAFVFPRIIGYTPAGRALVIDVKHSTHQERVSLLGPDGKPIELLAANDPPVAAIAEGTAFRVLQRSGALTLVTPGQAAQPDGALRAADLGIARRIKSTGRDSVGIWWIAAADATGDTTTIYRYDPATRGLLPEPAPTLPAGATRMALDPAGHVFIQTAAGAIWVQRRNGALTELATQLPAGVEFDRVAANYVSAGVVLGPDGAGYIGTPGAVYRLKDRQVTRVFGTAGKLDTSSSKIQIEPWGVTAAPDGTLFAVALDGGLFRLSPGGQAVRLAGKAGAASNPPVFEGPALDVSWAASRYVARDLAGNLFAASGFVQKLNPAGQVSKVLSFATALNPAENENPSGLAPAAEGAMWVGACAQGSARMRIAKVAADGQSTNAWGPAVPPGAVWEAGSQIEVGSDGSGGLYLAGFGKLWRWREGQEPVLVTEHEILKRVRAVTGDARGRVYVTHVADGVRIQRFDPAANTWTNLAGPDGPIFNDSASPDTSFDLVDAPVAFDGAGDLYVADPLNRQIKRVPGGGR